VTKKKEGLEEGLTPNELENSIATLISMEKKLNASVTFLRERKVETKSQNENMNTDTNNETNPTNSFNLVKEYLVRNNFDAEDFMEVRVAVVGNVDSGKSTLLGVLTHGVLDDGRGDASKLMNSKNIFVLNFLYI
jgi:GTPase